MPKVLISDKMAPLAADILRQKGVTVDVKPGMSVEELKSCIGDYDGLAIRSSTKVTEDIMQAATRLKIIGRAGIGVDNVDIPAATDRGIIVMNTPFGNSTTTAEHTIAMIMAMARSIPQADVSTKAGRWEKSKFMGVELAGKTLGVIGCGNIGAIVIDRAQGLKMRVIGYDPFLSDDRAAAMGIAKVSLDELYARADIITLHVPKTEQTANMINADAIARMKDGVRIVNVARGGLIDEAALLKGLESGKIAGAALDVFATEPATDSPLFALENVVCTPHLGASTLEAQDNVAIQVAEQIADYLTTGAVSNALNMPSISAEDAPRLRPYLKLVETLGLLAGQLADGPATRLTIEYAGAAAAVNGKPLTALAVASFLKPALESVNMVNAPAIAHKRGIAVSESRADADNEAALPPSVVITIEGKGRGLQIAGTLFADGMPRITALNGLRVETAVTPHMAFLRNTDKPGFIGRVGTILGESGMNIADFRLGRNEKGGEAVSFVSLDSPLDPDTIRKLKAIDGILDVSPLAF